MGEGLAGGEGPFVGGIMGQLGEFAIQDQLGPLRQQLSTTQLLSQPADGIPEAKHHDEDPEGDAEHGLHGVLELLEGPVQLELGLHAGLIGNGFAVGDQQTLVRLLLHIAKPVDPLTVLADLQLDHVGGPQQGGQPAGKGLLIVGHPQLLVDDLHQGVDPVLLQLHPHLAETEYPAEHHHGHGRDHAQRNKRDELSGQFHVPFRSRQHP